MASPLPWRERVRVREERSYHHPHLHPPPCLPAGRHQGGGECFEELDAPQLAAGSFTLRKASGSEALSEFGVLGFGVLLGF